MINLFQQKRSVEVKHFKAPSKTIGSLDARTSARLLAAAADISLVLDHAGKIKDVSYASEQLAQLDCGNWAGKGWRDVVTEESRPKIDDLLSGSESTGAGNWRQLNHPVEGQEDVPVRYIVLPLGNAKSYIAIGRDMSAEARLQQRLVTAQRELERDYARITQAETRYQALFRFSTEAILITDAATLEIIEANNAASSLFANGSRNLLGRRLTDFVADKSRSELDSVLAEARTMPHAEPVTVESVNGKVFRIEVAIFRDQARLMHLVRISDPAAPASESKQRENAERMFSLLRELPDSFVVLDKHHRVLWANQSFAELAQLATEDQAKSQPISQWLGRVEVDTDVLFASLDRSGAITRYKMVLRGAYGANIHVDVAAVSAPYAGSQYYGLVIRRDIAPTMPAPSEGPLPTAENLENLKDLVGRAPLKELVRQSTDIIERMCIEAALELTGDNRASAAEMLGLSRQSLYQKLRRHHIGLRGGDE